MIGENISNSRHYQFLDEVARAAGDELKQRFRRRLSVSIKPDRSIVTDADLASERIILSRVGATWPNDLILSEEAGLSKGHAAAGQYVWVVDPLDGTTNFANGYSFFSVSIARGLVQADGKIQPIAGAVYDVCNDILYFAEQGLGAFANRERIHVANAKAFASSFLVTGFYYQVGPDLDREIARFAKVAHRCPSIRRDGSAALDLALVASGVYDAFWENDLKPWDVAAGILLVEEAGGIVRNYHSDEDYNMTKSGLIAGQEAAVKTIGGLL